MRFLPLQSITAALLALAAVSAPAESARPRPDQAEFRGLYKELVETNTTLSAGSCTKAAQQIAARLRKAGFTDDQLVLYVPPNRPRDGGLVATWAGSDKSEPAMLLLAHLDVVEAKRQDWVRDPFTLIEEGGYFYGRGTNDDKAQAAIFADTVIRLKQSEFRPHRTIKLALTCGEEGSNAQVLNGAGWLVENRPDLLKAGFAFNEGGGGKTAPNGGPDTLGVEVGQKSPRNFVLEVTNPGGHSSVPRPDNAIYKLAIGLTKLSALQFPVHFNPVSRAYFAKVGPLRKDAIGEAMKRLVEQPDDRNAQQTIAAEPSLNAIIRTTCVATLLEAGHAINALPQRATASVNCRIVPGETADETKAAIEKAVADPEVKVLRSDIKERPIAVPPPLDPAILKPMEQIGAKHFPGVPVLPIQSTGATDATHLARIGVPTYGIPGLWNDPATAGTHGLNERISTDALYRGRDYMYDLISFTRRTERSVAFRRPMAALMLQGTGSDVGKSVLVAGLCRAFANRGLSVRPFKPQNMATNAAVTADGGEIGRAQALQAIAARTEPVTDMNPVLIKPHADRSAQLIVNGRVRGTLDTGNFREARAPLLGDVLAAYHRLAAACDIVVVEGAGSPAEINLRAGDIANMGFARAAGVPVILVGDIDRGGVIAAIVGTRTVLDPDDAAMIRGFIVNKFRGDPALFEDGYRQIEMLSDWRGFGVVPWLAAAARLPSEDAVILERAAPPGNGRHVIACPVTPHIANFDDLDPLKLEPGIDLRMIPPGRPIPAEAALVILAGSKATIADLHALRREGWDVDIRAHHRRGGRILGLCGGYQMLGRSVADPDGIEGPPGVAEGLGLLDVETLLTGAKTLDHVTGTALDAPFAGYEMHMGQTRGPDTMRPVGHFPDGRTEGATSADGRVAGTYVHGLFGMSAQRDAWLARLGVAGAGADYGASIDGALNAIAADLEAHLDVDGLMAIARGDS